MQFLRARLDEEEWIAKEALGWQTGSRYEEQPRAWVRHSECHTPARTFAEVEVKRRILDLHREVEDPQEMQTYCSECDLGRDKYPYYPCTTLRLLAVLYAGHPDYREEWRP